MADAFFPDGATVFVNAADSAPSAGFELTDHSTNFSQSGGDRDTESIPVFGGGNVTKENPRNQFEVSFDVIVQPAAATIFDEMLHSSTLTGTAASITSDGDGAALQFGLTWTDGSNTYTRTYNNAFVTNWEPEMSADEYLKGSVTFKMAPTTPGGTGNLTITFA